MTGYVPPLRDIEFVLRDLLDAESVLADMPAHADVDFGSLMAMAEQAGRFAVEAVLPLNADADRIGCRWHDGQVELPPGFDQAYREYNELGWGGMCAPEDEGGQGLPRLVSSLGAEMLSSASHSFMMLAGINHAAGLCLRHSASEALRQRWLPELASGQVAASMCMTEPQAGSDIGLLTTKAVPDEAAGEGRYRISGGKIFISGGEHGATTNILHLVLARISGSPVGSRGLSLFVVPKLLDDGSLNGVYCDGIEHKMGLHGSPTCTMRFDDAQAWLVGTADRGLAAMFPMMNEARLMSGLQALGLGERGLQLSLTYARERRQGRAPDGRQPCALIEHADVQRMLMLQKCWTEGARMLLHWTALVIDVAEAHPDSFIRREHAHLASLLTPVAKGFLSENAQRSLYEALQIHGGHGYVQETGVEQLVRDARIITIYEGATGIQARDLLMRKALGGEGGGMEPLFAQVEEWLREAEGQPDAAPFATALSQALDGVRQATAMLAGREQAQPGSALPACTSYLFLVGQLLLAWWWARAALACAGRDDEWHDAKRACAHFHYRHILPESAALLARLEDETQDWRAALA